MRPYKKNRGVCFCFPRFPPRPVFAPTGHTPHHPPFHPVAPPPPPLSLLPSCVVNLSPDKPAVLREAFRALAPGGEFYFSDVYADRRVPEAAQKDEVGEGRGGGEGLGRGREAGRAGFLHC